MEIDVSLEEMFLYTCEFIDVCEGRCDRFCRTSFSVGDNVARWCRYICQLTLFTGICSVSAVSRFKEGVDVSHFGFGNLSDRIGDAMLQSVHQRVLRNNQFRIRVKLEPL